MNFSWIRRTIPSTGFLVAGVVIPLAAFLMDLYIRTMDGQFETTPVNTPLTWTAILIVSVSYGVYRIYRFHPALDPEYHNWLEQTPWHAGLPLPVGPVHLVLQDLFIVGTLTAATLFLRGGDIRYVPLAFFLGYSILLIPTLIATRAASFGYAIAFGLGGLVLLLHLPVLQLALLLTLMIVSQLGLRRSLLEFPHWRPEELQRNISFFKSSFQLNNQINIQLFSSLFPSTRLGWPYDQLSVSRYSSAAQWISVPTSCLTGWYLFVALQRATDGLQRVNTMDWAPVSLYVVIFAIVLAVLRVAKYAAGFATPMNFWGRVMTLNWIIPGYDIIFIAPAVLILTGVLAAVGCYEWDLPAQIASPIATILLLLEFRYLPPDFDFWRLTGNHRIYLWGKDTKQELVQTQ